MDLARPFLVLPAIEIEIENSFEMAFNWEHAFHFCHEKNSFCVNHLRKGLMESSLPDLHREVFQRPLYQHSLRVNVGKDFGQVLLAL